MVSRTMKPLGIKYRQILAYINPLSLKISLYLLYSEIFNNITRKIAMDPIVINANSWHYQLVDRYLSAYRNAPTDLCEYLTQVGYAIGVCLALWALLGAFLVGTEITIYEIFFLRSQQLSNIVHLMVPIWIVFGGLGLFTVFWYWFGIVLEKLLTWFVNYRNSKPKIDVVISNTFKQDLKMVYGSITKNFCSRVVINYDN